MRKIKLGFTDTHDHLSKFFIYALSHRYDIELSNTPDFLIFGDTNFGNNNLRFSKNDCIKIFYTGENQRPTDYDCHYAISFDHMFEPWHYRLPLFLIYIWAWKHLHNMKYDIDYIFNVEKTKKESFCSFVVSNPNCQERNDFFKKLNSIKTVDSGGRLFNNIKANLDGEQAKIDFLSKRKFNICFEPYSYPGYTTEKIMHAFYANTIPIYWGNELISADFNKDSFIDAHSFKSFDDAIEYVMRVDSDEDLYQRYIDAPKFNAGIPPSYMILDNFLNWFDAIVYNKILKR